MFCFQTRISSSLSFPTRIIVFIRAKFDFSGSRHTAPWWRRIPRRRRNSSNYRAPRSCNSIIREGTFSLLLPEETPRLQRENRPAQRWRCVSSRQLFRALKLLAATFLGVGGPHPAVALPIFGPTARGALSRASFKNRFFFRCGHKQRELPET